MNSHIFDISKMADDFNGDDPSKVADFVWFSADEDTNMEGPIDSLGGIVRFALSQLTNHQYNVKAGDEFIKEQMSVIFDSESWKSSESTAVFLTFDEDYNNISFGIGNEGNHVVMVVIPIRRPSTRECAGAASAPAITTTTTACSAPSRTHSAWIH